LAEASYNGQPEYPAARLITGRLFLPEISDGCELSAAFKLRCFYRHGMARSPAQTAYLLGGVNPERQPSCSIMQ
jgi:hypothetical protein